MTKVNEQKPTEKAVRVARSIVREWVTKSRLAKEIIETVVSTHQQSLLIISIATALAARDVEIERLKCDKDHGEWMAAQLCAVEDALGCANDYDPKTGLVDTHSKVLEKIRDLIAAQGELGDLQAENQKQRALLVELKMWLAWCGSHAHMGIVRGNGVAMQFLQDIAKWSDEKSANPAVVELLKGEKV